MTEVLLSNARTEGPPMRIATDRSFLLRALRLGLTDLHFTEPHLAVIANDERRQYVWMPLSPEGALGPELDAVRIETPPAGPGDSQSSSQPTRRRSTMSATSPATAVVHPESAAPTSAEPVSHGGSEQNTATAVNSAPAAHGPVRTNGQAGRSRTRKGSRPANTGPIEQALALRDSLRESVTKANELIRSLKRQRQQSRLVQSTLASLKELQQAG
jgi:hypothetical protein